MSKESPQDHDSMSIVNRVRALMERNNIPHRSQATYLSTVLNNSYAHASRKLSGKSHFLLDQLKVIAEHFKVPLAELVGDAGQAELAEETGEIIDAEVSIAGSDWSCQVVLMPEDGLLTPFVLIDDAQTYRVVPRSEATHGRAVERIVLAFDGANKPRVAIVDDEVAWTETLCEVLADEGFRPEPFNDGASLRAALNHRQYDAFIVDWQVGPETGGDLINTIREKHPVSVPIILLTGKANAAIVAQAIRSLDVTYMPKPVENPIITAQLWKLLQRT